MPRQVSYIRFNETLSDNISYSKNYIKRDSGENEIISIVSGHATASPTFGFELIDSSNLDIQNAAADGQTKGVATFYDAQFDSSSGLITLDTLDGGSYD
jgi:hypothetical protein